MSSAPEDELNVDISQWKPRTVNTAPRPVAPPPRTFASINTPTAVPETTTGAEDDDLDIDAVIDGIAEDDPEPELESPAPTLLPTTTRRPTRDIEIVITKDANFDREAYTDCTYGANIVRRVLKEISQNEHVYYNVEFVDRHTEQVSPYYHSSATIHGGCLPIHTMLPSQPSQPSHISHHSLFTITLLLYPLSSTYIKGRRTLYPLYFLPLCLSNSRQLHNLNP